MGRFENLQPHLIGRPICLTYKANVSIVNALWVLLVGEKLDLHDDKLADIVKAIDNVLMSAQVSSLLALLFPTLFKWFHPRFKRAQMAFEKARSLVRPKIKQRAEMIFGDNYTITSDEGQTDFIDLYLLRIKGEKDGTSSFYGERGLKALECVLIDLFMGGSETTSSLLVWGILFLLHNPSVQASS